MAENTKIEWADHTFNPWTGCQKVSPACDHCYAEGWAKRSGLVQWGPHAERRRTSVANWRKPLTWNLRAGLAGVRQRVFCASLADVFDNAVPAEWRADLWTLIAQTPHLDWLLLTKRPGNIANMLPVPFDFERLYPNVWLGCTVVNQEEADRDIPKLLDTPAAVRFLSMEPLLGPVDLNALPCGRQKNMSALGPGYLFNDPPFVDWVIVGGESGPGARPMHPDWVRSLREQCQAAGVSFLFKQVGDWTWWEPDSPPLWRNAAGTLADGNCLFPADMDNDPKWDDGLGIYQPGLTGHCAFERVGKKHAGRLLDGRTWDQMPGDAG